MRTKYATRKKMQERLIIWVPAEMKSSLFEAAARRGISAAQLTRSGITSILAA